MLDIKLIRDTPHSLDAALARRGLPPLAQELLDMDSRRRALLTESQETQQKRNDLSRKIGEVKKSGGDDAPLRAEVDALKERLAILEQEEAKLGGELDSRLAAIPNIPEDSVPDGPDEAANVELRRFGNPTPSDSAREHFELGETLGLMDFEAASALSGARFVVLRGALARLERALAQFMLDLHTTEHGYTEISPPLLVREDALFGTGQFPKFREDQFGVNNGLWLIPTAEVPLTNLVREKVLDEECLPLRVTAHTPCFRAEAGSAGRDTRGMLRQHQFYKVEMVSVTTPEQSAQEHERMTECAETVLKRLELPFRTVVLCTGDMGFSARKTYDIEVWMPGQGRYREISSCSNCGDFQARRMQTKCRAKGGKSSRFVHSLNGSGVAVGRCLIAVVENGQQPDGSILIPAALRPYMGGMERISPSS
ncbi:MAG: serine--tRNA ligase [Alphaproteobacteria bacterium]|nr:MAG: serine--tRNA ligase [Alphaproteobacteria bacterium]